ncbi:MIP family channel protein [Bremerella cremea]|uniref:Aquaporin n=1 Tax=Blastopirellula marina TaxID=124 RepID=A0A2S8G5F5_9BACT|nr:MULTISPECIES: MIP family channel protein [Pirellulaceae]PQO39685.1 aquaporin [Blastopirellula marina]RCS51152.1 MIP family channel protein [Bremerella cremea]
MRRYLAEVIGTFGLVFAGCGAIVINQLQDGAITHVGIALTFGLIVMVMIYALGEISGAHMNPAVTLGFWTAKRFPLKEVAPYIAAQCLGSILACVVLKILFFEHDTLGATLPTGDWWKSFVLEFILTFLLMFVVLNISTGAKEKGIMAGAAIGGMVALEAMFAGPICGASMNPARSLGPALVSGHLEFLWLYLVATTAGALFAVPIHFAIYGSEAPSTDPLTSEENHP